MSMKPAADMPAERLLHRERFPRSARYDLDWILANEMGPNALWLLEDLCKDFSLEAGMRVLDLGCGRAMTSIFLAREFDVQVCALDLWISPDENWKRVEEAGLGPSILPLRAESRAMPFAAESFDAIVSIDSYQYYGTDDLYLSYLLRFLKPGGRFGLVLPSILKEFEGEPPEHLTRRQASGATFWDPCECFCLHAPSWWNRHLSRPGLLEELTVDAMAEGCRLWLDWERLRDGGGFTAFPSEAEVLEADGGEWIGFTRVLARKRKDLPPPADHAWTMRL